MNQRLFLFLFGLCAAITTTAPAGDARPPLSKSDAANSEFQNQLHQMFARFSMDTFLSHTPELIELARQQGLTHEEVLRQSVIYITRIEDKEVRYPQAIFLALHLKHVFRIQDMMMIKGLIPFLEEEEQPERQKIALDMLEAAGYFTVTEKFGFLSRFDAINEYLHEVPAVTPPYKLMARMYSGHPSAAVRTIASVFAKDEQTRQYVQESTRMIDKLAEKLWRPKGEVKAIHSQLEKKIEELLISPHWFIRFYAAALIYRPELRELSITNSLKGDANEMVSRFVKDASEVHKSDQR